jgi:hypothetical protein
MGIMSDKKPVNVKAILVISLAVALGFALIDAKTSGNSNRTYTNTKSPVSNSEPDESIKETMACNSASLTTDGVIKAVGMYTSHPSRHKSLGKTLAGQAKELDAQWKKLQPGVTYNSILGLANDVDLLAKTIATNNSEDAFVILSQFRDDYVTFQSVCNL